jgi:NAD(P)-dependent dehydrogenase (short-subunit alcohol dehydrogenase family)
MSEVPSSATADSPGAQSDVALSLWPGRTAVFVTGASSGIGAAIAIEWARLGFTVGCASRRGTTPESSPRLIGLKLDVCDEDSVGRVIDEFVSDHGPLAGVMNVAGYYEPTPSASLPMDELRNVLETNLVSAINVSQRAFPMFQEHGGGFIGNIGSFYADLGVPNSLAYAASKAGMAAATRTLAVEWARYGISLVNFEPGYIETGLNAEYLKDPENRARIEQKIPARRVGTADEVARLVVRVLTSDCSFLTGESIRIDGGQAIRL